MGNTANAHPSLSRHALALTSTTFLRNNRGQPRSFIVWYQTYLPMLPLTLRPFLTAQKGLSAAHRPVTPPASGPHALHRLVCVHIFTHPSSLPGPATCLSPTPTPRVPITMKSCSQISHLEVRTLCLDPTPHLLHSYRPSVSNFHTPSSTKPPLLTFPRNAPSAPITKTVALGGSLRPTSRCPQAPAHVQHLAHLRVPLAALTTSTHSSAWGSVLVTGACLVHRVDQKYLSE